MPDPTESAPLNRVVSAPTPALLCPDFIPPPGPVGARRIVLVCGEVEFVSEGPEYAKALNPRWHCPECGGRLLTTRREYLPPIDSVFDVVIQRYDECSWCEWRRVL
jgi:hypothetical protein